MNINPLRSTLSRFQSPLRRSQGNFDASLQPYVPQVIAEEQQKQNQFQPLQFVLDVLQRGQYLTANIADEVQHSFATGKPLGDSTMSVLNAAFQGITGQRKGDWETLLFGGNIPGGGARPGWLPDSLKAGADEPLIRWGGQGTTGLAEGIVRPRKLIGLAANIAGDPLTYLSFGATKAAEAVAAKYAEDVVKLHVATMGPDEFAKLGLNFSQKVGKNAGDIIKAIPQGNLIAKRSFEDVYNKAYQNALRNPSAKLMEDIAPQLNLAQTRVADNPGLSGLLQGITPEAYSAAGQRSVNFMGKQMATGVRQPMAPIRAWDAIKARFDSQVGGSKLGDAWYSVMNNGVVGQIRKAFGIRNPYEQMIHLKQRNIADIGMHTTAEQGAAMVAQQFGKYDQQTIQHAANAVVRAQSDAGLKPADAAVSDVRNRILDPQFQANLGIKPEEVDKVRHLLDVKSEIDKKLLTEEQDAAAKAGETGPTESLNYFPQGNVGAGEMGGNTVKSGGASGQGGTAFTKGKSVTVEQRIQSNADMLKFLIGDQLDKAWKDGGSQGDFNDFVKKFVEQHNLSETTLNIQDAYRLRAIAHAKFMAKYNMIDEFRQFGVPVQDAISSGIPESQLATYGQGASQIGLYKLDPQVFPAYKDYLFDEPVAKAITTAVPYINGDQSTMALAKAFNYFTTMWKGFTTMTPGFHIRNFISNNVTGFLKFGPRWFDASTTFGPVAAGVAYAMHPEKYADLLKETLNVSDGWIARQLNKDMGGGLSVKDLADYARQKGTIGSRLTQVGQEGIGLGQKANPLSKQFVGFKYSKDVGDIIENTSKFQSFLLDYLDASKGAAKGGTLPETLANHKAALEYADQQTKKWFIDYGDLTPFEQNVMKKVIPFYTWMRKNIANQLSGIVLYPETYSVIPKVRQSLTNDEGFNYNLMPDYMKNSGYYPVGQTAQGTNILRWANIPLEDLNKIPLMFNNNQLTGVHFSGSEILTDIMSNAHPLIKSVVEMATGKDLFHQRDIRPFETAAPVFQYLANSPKVVQFLDGAMRTAGFGNGLRIKVSQDGKEVQMDGKTQRLLDSNVPALRTLDMLVSTPEVMAETMSPAVETWIEQTFGKTDSYTALQKLFQVVSRVGGWKFTEVSQDEQAKLKEAQMRARLTQLKSQTQNEQAANDARAAKARKAAETRNRRLFGGYTR